MTTRHPPQFFLSLYGWTFWVPAAITGLLGMLVPLIIPGMWWLSVVFAVATFATLAFYRDFNRPIPKQAGVMVAPADGKVTEISHIEHYAPFNGPALKVGIFLSVLDVHVNRAPCDGVVLWTRYEEGAFLDARHVDCATKNQSNTICIGPSGVDALVGRQATGPTGASAPLLAPTSVPIAVVKQIVGAIARRIIAPLTVGETLTRGQRIGMIAFGSRTELYVPAAERQPAVALGAHVKGGRDVLLCK